MGGLKQQKLLSHSSGGKTQIKVGKAMLSEGYRRGFFPASSYLLGNSWP